MTSPTAPLPTPHGNSRPSTDCTVLPFQRGSHCRPCPPTGAGAGNPVFITTVERVGKTAEQIAARRHYEREVRMGRVALHPPFSLSEKLWTVGTLALVGWIALYFAWQFLGRPGL